MNTPSLGQSVFLPSIASWITTTALGLFRAYSALLLGPAIAIATWFLPTGLEPVQQKALAITTFMIFYWGAEPIDHGLTALVGIYLFWALGVAKFSAAFSGFINPTTWFLFSSLLIAEAAAGSGLAKRIGFLVMSRVGSSPVNCSPACSGCPFCSPSLCPPAWGGWRSSRH